MVDGRLQPNVNHVLENQFTSILTVWVYVTIGNCVYVTLWGIRERSKKKPFADPRFLLAFNPFSLRTAYFATCADHLLPADGAIAAKYEEAWEDWGTEQTEGGEERKGGEDKFITSFLFIKPNALCTLG